MDFVNLLIKFGALAVALIAIGIGYYYYKGLVMEEKQEEVKEVRDSDDYFISGSPIIGDDYQ